MSDTTAGGLDLQSDYLGHLVAAVRGSARYSDICPEVVRAVGTRALAEHASLKEAVKATRSKLHQVGGAYLATRRPYARWLSALRSAREEGAAALQAQCLEIMGAHASSRERLGILAEFYARTLAPLAPVHAVLDIACGLNPLAIPWMPLAPGATYYATDMYLGMVAFLDQALQLLGQPGGASACDVLHPPSLPQVDVALLLKALPCLEQLDRPAAAALLERLPARVLVISFPSHSLGGRKKGMPAHYEAHLRQLLAGKGWSLERFGFRTELAFVVHKG